MYCDCGTKTIECRENIAKWNVIENREFSWWRFCHRLASWWLMVFSFPIYYYKLVFCVFIITGIMQMAKSRPENPVSAQDFLLDSNSSTPWWRHQMETFSALLVICAGNSPVTNEFPAQRKVTRSFDVFFDLRLNNWLSKQWWGWWFETPFRPLWRHCNVDWRSWHYLWDECLIGSKRMVWGIVYFNRSAQCIKSSLFVLCSALLWLCTNSFTIHFWRWGYPVIASYKQYGRHVI